MCGIETNCSENPFINKNQKSCCQPDSDRKSHQWQFERLSQTLEQQVEAPNNEIHIRKWFSSFFFFFSLPTKFHERLANGSLIFLIGIVCSYIKRNALAWDTVHNISECWSVTPVSSSTHLFRPGKYTCTQTSNSALAFRPAVVHIILYSGQK